MTLNGPGGVGKTRLAIQAAAELLEEFADGIYFVDLAPISDPDLVVAAIAQTLRVRETGGQPLLDSADGHVALVRRSAVAPLAVGVAEVMLFQQ